MPWPHVLRTAPSSGAVGPFRVDAQFVDGALLPGLVECGVDQLVLVDPREAVEGLVVDDHLEVVAAAGPVDHLDLLGLRERALEALLDPLPHACMVAGSRTRR